MGIKQEEFEDTKGLIRIRKSKKNRQHNDQKDKQRSTKHICKTKDRVNRTPIKPGGELRCSGRVSSSCSTSDTLVRSDLLVVSAPIQYIYSFPFCTFSFGHCDVCSSAIYGFCLPLWYLQTLLPFGNLHFHPHIYANATYSLHDFFNTFCRR